MTKQLESVLDKLADIMSNGMTKADFATIDPGQFVCDAYAAVMPGHEPMLTDEEVSLVCNMSDYSLHTAVMSRMYR